ncbi:hypothetical protein [Planctomicrobium sp. SH527]|uniref:hypothetical protein n=1 Tax=Planctomicrobium sp. SH527 TaxID=3448123 RepID=UPI003F5BFCD6
MKRFASIVALAALTTATGCCAQRACSPCGGGGGYGYGAGYSPAVQSFQQPQYMQPNCPTGNCNGVYPSGSLQPIGQQVMMPGTTTAYAPTSTVALDYKPF